MGLPNVDAEADNETVVDVEVAPTATVAAALVLNRLFVLPSYFTVIVGEPAAVSVYVNVHDPEESVHELAPKVPVLSEVVNVSTVPVGLYPATVTTQSADIPAVVAEHDRDVVVDALLTVNAVEVPVLPE